MAPRTRLPLAALALAALLSPASAEWKFCAPEGGHCQCFGEMRYGHPGQAQHHSDGGAYFKEHPEVTKWTSRDASGLQEGCSLAHFGGVDPFPALGNAKFCECNVPEEVVWMPCAGPGEVCDCAAASLGSLPADADSSDASIWAPDSRVPPLGARGAPARAVVRATDDAGGYYGVASVDGAFTCPDDYPGARCECLVPAPAPRMAWQWCANDGGHCACTSSMRFGSTGTREQYESGYFETHPLVKKWVTKDASALASADGMNACGADAFDGVDPFPDADEKICQCMMPTHDEARANVLEWRWCANEGGRCACDTAARFGNTGAPELYAPGNDFFKAHPEVTKWTTRGDAPGSFECGASAFALDGDDPIDPFPGVAKICQCLAERPRALGAAEAVDRATEVTHTDWSWCGEDGARCACDGLVRYGSTGEDAMYAENGAWFKAHPEVMKWTYLKSYGELECSRRTFGFDPFPDQRKICQCFEGYDEQFPYQEFRPQTAALGAAMQAADAEPDILSLKVRDRPVVAQEIERALAAGETAEREETTSGDDVVADAPSDETRERSRGSLAPRLGRTRPGRDQAASLAVSPTTLGWAAAVVAAAAAVASATVRRAADYVSYDFDTERGSAPEKTPLVARAV